MQWFRSKIKFTKVNRLTIEPDDQRPVWSADGWGSGGGRGVDLLSRRRTLRPVLDRMHAASAAMPSRPGLVLDRFFKQTDRRANWWTLFYFQLDVLKVWIQSLGVYKTIVYFKYSFAKSKCVLKFVLIKKRENIICVPRLCYAKDRGKILNIYQFCNGVVGGEHLGDEDDPKSSDIISRQI